MPALPFKLNQDRRRHIPEQKRKVTNWRDYDESLRHVVAGCTARG